MSSMPYSQPSPTQKDANDAFFDSLWSDDMYMKQIEQYKNESWYDRLLENPWLRSKQARFQSDPFTEMFNFQGAATKYYGDMRVNAEDWLSKRVAEMKEQEYNSAPEQAARLRAAGQNPDLNGGVTAGEAAQNDTATAPAQLQNGTSETGLAIAQAGMNFIGNILSFGKEIQGFSLGAANLAASELSLNDSAFDSVVKQVASLIPLKDLDKPKDVDSVDIPAAVKEAKFNLSGVSRKGRKFFKRWLDQLSNGESMSVDAVRSELRRRILENNRTSAEIMSSPYYSSDLNEWISNIGDKLSKYIAQCNEFQARVSANKARVENSYWSNKQNQQLLNDTMSAEQSAALQSAEASSAYHEWKKGADETWNELEKTVKGDGKHWYNTIGVIMLYFLRSQVEGATLGFSSGGKSTSTTTILGDGSVQQQSHRTSGSFHF